MLNDRDLPIYEFDEGTGQALDFDGRSTGPETVAFPPDPAAVERAEQHRRSREHDPFAKSIQAEREARQRQEEVERRGYPDVAEMPVWFVALVKSGAITLNDPDLSAAVNH